MWSFVGSDTVEIPVRRGWAQKDPHLQIEEPEPYIYDQLPEPVRKSAESYRPVDGNVISQNARQILQFQEDALRTSPYDLDHKDVNAVSERPTVDAFLRLPNTPQWKLYGRVNPSAQTKRFHIETYKESSTRGASQINHERDRKILVDDYHEKAKLKNWEHDSKPGKNIAKTPFVDPVLKGNLQEPLADTIKQDPGIHTIQARMGTSRFRINKQHKIEDAASNIDPTRDPHLLVNGRAHTQNIILTEKMDGIYKPITKEYRFKINGRASTENIKLHEKTDGRVKHQYRQGLKNRIDPADPQSAKYARYTPALTPNLTVTKVVPSTKGIETKTPNFHSPMNVDNQGWDGLDLTGSSMPELSSTPLPQIYGIRKGIKNC